MAVVPGKKTEQIQWFSQRAPVWMTNIVPLGLTNEQALALQDAVDGASSAEVSLADAKQALKNAYLDYNAAVSSMNEVGRPMIKTIKTKAETNPSLYILAQIPPPAEPTPAPPPAAPTEVSGEVGSCGAVKLSWKAKTGGSIFFSVYRRLPGESSLKLIGSTGAKKYADRTVPAGAEQATYVIYAQRVDQASGPTEPLVVLFNCEPPTAKNLKMLKAA